MVKKTIAIDIDDTLADSLEAFRVLVNEHAEINLQTEDYNKNYGLYWGHYERVWLEHGVTEKIDKELIHQTLHDSQDLIQLLPGAKEAVSYLSKRFRIVLITARDIKWAKPTREWLSQQFGGEAPEVYFSDAHRENGTHTKGQLCRELNAEWLIDDNVQHLQDASKYGVQGILFGQYGWQFGSTAGLIKAKDWGAVLEYFDNVSR